MIRQAHVASSPRLAVVLVLAAAACNAAHAQSCDPAWLAGSGVNGIGPGSVLASTRWDPDGPGPLNEVVVLAGDFAFAGTISAGRIATYDPQTGAWGTLGTGFNDRVNALAITPSNELIAVGAFTTADGQSANRIARWTGSGWARFGFPMGNGTNNEINAVLVEPDGSIVVGGFFTNAGGTNGINRIARWNGSAWSGFGMGLGDSVQALARLSNGDLIASGTFTTAGTTSVQRIARWNGSTWSTLGTGIAGTPTPTGLALAPLPNNGVAVGGSFTSAGTGPGAYFGRFAFNLAPQVVQNPASIAAPLNDFAAFIAQATIGAPNVASQWQIESSPNSNDFVNISDGPIPGGDGALASTDPDAAGTVVGSASLFIQPLTAALSGRRVRVVFSNACGASTSAAATLVVRPPACSPADIADTDGLPTPDGVVDNGDFSAFFEAFFLPADQPGVLLADIANTDGQTTLDGAGPDGIVDNGDFSAFFLFFFQGCGQG